MHMIYLHILAHTCIYLYIQTYAHHCREGSLRGSCCLARQQGGALPPRLAVMGLGTGTTSAERAGIDQTGQWRTQNEALDTCILLSGISVLIEYKYLQTDNWLY